VAAPHKGTVTGLEPAATTDACHSVQCFACKWPFNYATVPGPDTMVMWGEVQIRNTRADRYGSDVADFVE